VKRVAEVFPLDEGKAEEIDGIQSSTV